jgi:hypothetical protein
MDLGTIRRFEFKIGSGPFENRRSIKAGNWQVFDRLDAARLKGEE